MSSEPRRSRIVPRIVVLLVVIGLLGIFDPFGFQKKTVEKSGTTVVCTFLPVYVFALNVIGNLPDVNVELLVSPDVGCPHHYTLRPADQMKMARADVVIANGLGMESFLDELMKSHPKVKVITTADDCDVIPTRCTHDHAHGEHETEQGKIEVVYSAHSDLDKVAEDNKKHFEHAHGPNGHVWVSPTEAIKQVQTLTRKLGEIDPGRRTVYDLNAINYVANLKLLQARVEQAKSGFVNRKIVTMHDSFDYLARDLGLEVVGLLQLEPDQSPTAHEMTELVDTIKREKVAAIFYEPSSPVRVAETIARDSGVPAYELNPFTSFAGTPNALSYEEVMVKNLEILKKALGGGS